MMSATLSTLSPPLARRVQAVLALLRGLPAAQVAAQFRCYRSDLYKWCQRALAVLPAALADQPRGPKQPHNRVAPEQEARVVALCARHPTWSSYQISRRLGPEAPVPRTIQRLRVRHGLPRVPKRATPCTRRMRVLPTAIQQARQLIRAKPFLGPERLAWELQNTAQLQISPATLKRLKRRMHTEAHPMALPWVLERLETAARYAMGRKRVPASGALQMFRRQVYLDATLGGQEVTMYETLDGLEIRSADQQGYLLRHYRTWLNRFTWTGGQLLPADLHFEVCGGESCPRIAVAQ